MRYPPEHKARTRRRIVKEAARRFRADGIHATGVAAIMKACDLTVGGFYKHFSSKAELVRDALEASVERTHRFLAGASADQPEWIAQAARVYLSRSHVEDVASGCPLPALAPEIARADDATRQAWSAVLIGLVDALESAMPGPRPRQRAWSFLAMLVGGLMLARASDDPELRREILVACRAGATADLGAAGAPPRGPEHAPRPRDRDDVHTPT